MSRIRTLSFLATVGTIAANADGSHQQVVLHATPGDGIASGQVALLLPRATKADGTRDEDSGLEPGEYSVSLSLVRTTEQMTATPTVSAPLVSGTQVESNNAALAAARTRVTGTSA
jgi:hypothetical protein